MSFVEALASVPRLHGFAFTPDGRHAARLIDRDGALAVEVADLERGLDSERVYGPDPLLSPNTHLTFPSQDHIRTCSLLDGRLRIVEIRRTGDVPPWTAELIAELSDEEADAVRLLPRLEGADWDLVISCDDGTSTIWRIEHHQPRLRPLAQLSGLLAGGSWLDPGRRLAIDLSEPDGKASGYVVNLAEQTYHRSFHISDHSNDRIVLCDPRRGLLGVTSDCFGHRRAGVAHLDNGRTVRFFPDLEGEDRAVELCDPSGRELILRRQRGLVTELWLADTNDLSVSGPLRLPSGVVSQPVVRAGDRIRFLFGNPTIPAVSASYLPAQEMFSLDETPDLGDLPGSDLLTPRIVSFHGPRGAVEALRYEPPACRQRDLVVVAVHGGPVEQWSATFTPELQLLAGLGTVVVAPNYHGSTGYGQEFVRSLEGAAGSVDIDDVVAVTTALRVEGGSRRVVLYGQSYGAFLALLVAARHPELCDGVIAVSPFASLSSLRAVGAPPVQRLVDLLRDPTHDEEATDLLHRCGDLRAKLLIVHGSRDSLIPSDQSLMLCDRLRAYGYQDGEDLWFLQLPDEDHMITSRVAVLQLYHQIESFLFQIAAPPGGRREMDHQRSRT
ncbi:MAG: alpha/beta hydrolase family protein [Egibacteraceae bacterium]